MRIEPYGSRYWMPVRWSEPAGPTFRRTLGGREPTGATPTDASASPAPPARGSLEGLIEQVFSDLRRIGALGDDRPDGADQTGHVDVRV